MFEKSIFSVVATPASSILIRSSSFLVVKKKKKKKKKKKLCPMTVLVDSRVSDRCPLATCFYYVKVGFQGVYIARRYRSVGTGDHNLKLPFGNKHLVLLKKVSITQLRHLGFRPVLP